MADLKTTMQYQIDIIIMPKSIFLYMKEYIFLKPLKWILNKVY